MYYKLSLKIMFLQVTTKNENRYRYNHKSNSLKKIIFESSSKRCLMITQSDIIYLIQFSIDI